MFWRHLETHKINTSRCSRNFACYWIFYREHSRRTEVTTNDLEKWCPMTPLLTLTSVFTNDIASMDNTGYVTENCQEDVDRQVSFASSFQENSQRWKEDGKEEFANIRARQRHLSSGWFFLVDFRMISLQYWFGIVSGTQKSEKLRPKMKIKSFMTYVGGNNSTSVL